MHSRTLMPLLVLPLLLGASPVLTPFTAAAPIAEPGDTEQIEQAFRRAAALSRSPRSGDLYTLAQPYHFLGGGNPNRRQISHFKGADGQVRQIEHFGTSHGSMWQYDTRIPLVFYGPGRVKANHRPRTAASQVDLAATYAWLLGVNPPRDTAGQPLKDAFLPAPTPPKVILTILIDQGGRSLYAAHPQSWPNIKRLMEAGTDYPNAQVTHLESETALGHVAVGTGAYPDRTGIPANYFFSGAFGAKAYSFQGEADSSPLFLESPTFGDHWLRATQNQAILISQCYSDRAAIGMAGHGSYYKGNKKPIVVFYDDKKGALTTNPTYYTMPDYLAGYTAKPYWQAFTDEQGRWFGHPMANPQALRQMPGMAKLDGDAFLAMIDREPVGKDDVTDLLYLTLKATDAAGHRFGLESLEAEAVLRESDHQVGRLVAALEKKVGRDNVLVAISADHGGCPLPELSGGARMSEADLINGINQRFMTKDKRSPIALYVTNTQIWLDDQALAANGATRADIIQYLLGLQLNGKPYYRMVLDRTEVESERSRLLAESYKHSIGQAR